MTLPATTGFTFPVLRAITARAAGAVLPKTDASVEASVSSWHQEVRDLCLLMTRKLNAPVQAYISKPHRDDPELRMRDDCEHLSRTTSSTPGWIFPMPPRLWKWSPIWCAAVSASI